jgi:hypothetical protein
VSDDYSRFSFKAVKHFASVLLQQGRVRLDSDAKDTYTPLRRIVTFVEHSIDQGLQWVGFEPRFRRPKRHRPW